MADAQPRSEIERLREEVDALRIANTALFHAVFEILIDEKVLHLDAVLAHLRGGIDKLDDSNPRAHQLKRIATVLAQTLETRRGKATGERPPLTVIEGGLSDETPDQ